MCDLHEKAKLSTLPIIRGLVEVVMNRTTKFKVTSMRETHCAECPFRAESTFSFNDGSTVKSIVEDYPKSEWTYGEWLKYLISLVSKLDKPFSCHRHADQFCKGASLVQPLVNTKDFPIFNQESKG